jgi:hypothetical protein
MLSLWFSIDPGMTIGDLPWKARINKDNFATEKIAVAMGIGFGQSGDGSDGLSCPIKGCEKSHGTSERSRFELSKAEIIMISFRMFFR